MLPEVQRTRAHLCGRLEASATKPAPAGREPQAVVRGASTAKVLVPTNPVRAVRALGQLMLLGAPASARAASIRLSNARAGQFPRPTKAVEELEALRRPAVDGPAPARTPTPATARALLSVQPLLGLPHELARPISNRIAAPARPLLAPTGRLGARTSAVTTATTGTRLDLRCQQPPFLTKAAPVRSASTRPLSAHATEQDDVGSARQSGDGATRATREGRQPSS